MSAQQINDILQQWSDGDRNGFKQYFAQHTDILHTYKGTGDIFDYLTPALYIKEFCHDLIAAGFPVEELFADNLNDFLWVEWPFAQEYVVRHAPQLLIDLDADGPPKHHFPSFGDGEYSAEDRRKILDCLPEKLAHEVDRISKEFANSSDEQWQERFAIVGSLVKHPLLKKVG